MVVGSFGSARVPSGVAIAGAENIRSTARCSGRAELHISMANGRTEPMVANTEARRRTQRVWGNRNDECTHARARYKTRSCTHKTLGSGSLQTARGEPARSLPVPMFAKRLRGAGTWPWQAKRSPRRAHGPCAIVPAKLGPHNLHIITEPRRYRSARSDVRLRDRSSYVVYDCGCREWIKFAGRFLASGIMCVTLQYI